MGRRGGEGENRGCCAQLFSESSLHLGKQRNSIYIPTHSSPGLPGILHTNVLNCLQILYTNCVQLYFLPIMALSVELFQFVSF